MGLGGRRGPSLAEKGSAQHPPCASSSSRKFRGIVIRRRAWPAHRPARRGSEASPPHKQMRTVSTLFSLRRPDLLAVLTFSLIAAGASLVVWPVQDVPLVDDWTYAWSVEQL